jgi:drug/metabolite transporter (DMT)-like permease
MSNLSDRLSAEIALFGATLLWGGTFVVVKVGVSQVSPLLLVALRFSIASGIFFLLSPRVLLKIDRRTLLQATRLGFFLFLGFGAQTAGLLYTGASKSAFITGTLVVFTPIFQIAFEKRTPRNGTWIGILIVTLGLWLLTSPGAGGINRGDFLTLLCAIFFAFYIVDLGRVTRGADPASIVLVQMLFAALFSWLALPLVETPVFRPTPALFWILGYTALPATLATTWIQTRFQPKTSPTRAAIIYTLEPVWAAVLGFFFLGERLSAGRLLGAGLILFGVLFSELSGSLFSLPARGNPLKEGE